MKKALITGATGGIGLEICKFLGNDHEIYILGRNEEKLINLSNKFSFIKEYFVCDISEVKSLQDFFEKISMKNLQIDVLVNNAGVTDDSLFLRMDLKKWNKVININLNSNFMISNFFSKQMMKNKWGRIVNITSQAVKAPVPALGLSNSARTGLTGYVAGTSRQVARFGVNINNLLPGMHDTKRLIDLDKALSKEKSISFQEARNLRKDTIPVGRYGSIEEFGNTCAFLCSQYAGFIVGQNILLDVGAVNSTI